MFYTIAATAKEMTGTAGIAAGFTDILCNIGQINAVFRKTGVTRRFAVFPGGVVAYQAVDIFSAVKSKFSSFQP